MPVWNPFTWDAFENVLRLESCMPVLLGAKASKYGGRDDSACIVLKSSFDLIWLKNNGNIMHLPSKSTFIEST